MPHGFFFAAVLSFRCRFNRLSRCVSKIFYVVTHCLIRQTDHIVYHNLFITHQHAVSLLCFSQIQTKPPCSKPYNHQIL